jgi:hypothetical protein
MKKSILSCYRPHPHNLVGKEGCKKGGALPFLHLMVGRIVGRRVDRMVGKIIGRIVGRIVCRMVG